MEQAKSDAELLHEALREPEGPVILGNFYEGMEYVTSHQGPVWFDVSKETLWRCDKCPSILPGQGGKLWRVSDGHTHDSETK